MIEPLPKARSIWLRAASKALVLCTPSLSMTLRTVVIGLVLPGLFHRRRNQRNDGRVHALFQLSSRIIALLYLTNHTQALEYPHRSGVFDERSQQAVFPR